MTRLSWKAESAADLALFYGDAQSSPERQEARAWLDEMDALLRRVPASVTVAQPMHSDNVEVMNNALHDVRGDVIGFYRKEEER